MDPSLYSPDRSVSAKIKRRLTYWRTAKPIGRIPENGMVSFTFDDFPRSAAEYGAEVLQSNDARGTFYVCTGMLGQSNIMGDMFSAYDLETLGSAGHSIATHTHNHIDCARVNPVTVRNEIKKNQSGLLDLQVGQDLSHFAWPYGETTAENKMEIGDLISTARGILPGINRKGSDLMQLGAFELTPDLWTIKRASGAIERAARKGGWTIIFTHDVQANPSPFGTKPHALQHLVKQSRDAGLEILTIPEAFSRLNQEDISA